MGFVTTYTRELFECTLVILREMCVNFAWNSFETDAN